MWLNKLSHELRHTTPGLGRDYVLSLGDRLRVVNYILFLSWFLTEYMEMLVSGQVEGMSKNPSVALSLKWGSGLVW